MRNVIVSTYMTLDGKIDGVREWAVPYNDDGAVKHHTDLLANSDGLLLGRRTYELFTALWPPRAGEFAYVDKINSMAKYVASTTLSDLEWENSHLLEGDVAEAVGRLKESDKDLVVLGSGELLQTLIAHNLIDEYLLLIYPLVLGSGRRMFTEDAGFSKLRLVDTVTTTTGVVIATYRSANDG